jgi:hypothetical protein
MVGCVVGSDGIVEVGGVAGGEEMVDAGSAGTTGASTVEAESVAGGGAGAARSAGRRKAMVRMVVGCMLKIFWGPFGGVV